MAELHLDSIERRFGAVHAVRGVSVSFRPGEIHAVVGENGAGKSTLLRIGAGLLVPDSGTVRIDDRPLTPHTPREALARGVAMVEQHFALVGVFDALENIILGAEPTRGPGLLDRAAAAKRITAIVRELDLDLPLDVPVEELGVGERQRVEIVRVLFREAKVVILDEPTAVLTPTEAQALYATLRRLAAQGRAVAVVTHKLDEVHAYADRVTVLRHGARVLTRAVDRKRARAEETDALATAIMGETSRDDVVRAPTAKGEPRLVIEDVHVGRALRGVALTVRSGEVVGVAGVEGNGQRELVAVLSGLRAPDRGRVLIDGATTRDDDVAVVFEDRHALGLVLDADVEENLLLGDLGQFSRGGFLDTSGIRNEAERRLANGGVEPPDRTLPARALSGGNQQKIVIARAMARVERGARALVLSHPTRGVDQRTSRAIFRRVIEAAAGGAAVLVLSADLAELRTLADRILVIAKGAFVGEFAPTATDAEIGRAMLGLGQVPP